MTSRLFIVIQCLLVDKGCAPGSCGPKRSRDTGSCPEPRWKSAARLSWPTSWTVLETAYLGARKRHLCCCKAMYLRESDMQLYCSKSWLISVYHFTWLMDFHGGSVVKKQPAMWETQKTWVQSPGQEDPMEEGVTSHSSIIAWKIPWIEEPGRLQSMMLQSQTWLKRHRMHANYLGRKSRVVGGKERFLAYLPMGEGRMLLFVYHRSWRTL